MFANAGLDNGSGHSVQNGIDALSVSKQSDVDGEFISSEQIRLANILSHEFRVYRP